MSKLFTPNWPQTKRALQQGNPLMTVSAIGKGTTLNRLPGGSLIINGSMAITQRGTIMYSGNAKSNKEYPEIDIQKLKEAYEKMGLDPDIKDAVKDINDLYQKLQRKNLELHILEMTAMESTDENVKDLREQLFTTVKLIHSEEIEEMMNDERLARQFINDDAFGFDRYDSTQKPQETIKENVFTRVMNAYRDYQGLRAEIRALKKRRKATGDIDLSKFGIDSGSSSG